MQSIRYYLAAVTMLAVVGCAATDIFEPEWPELPSGAAAVQYAVLDEVHTTVISNIPDRRRVVIRTQQAWASFWNEFTDNLSSPPDQPNIDFDQQMVIAATMGQRNTGGYTISIDGIFLDNDELIVRVLETMPGAGCLTIQAVTAPATAVVLDAVGTDPEFVEGTAATRC